MSIQNQSSRWVTWSTRESILNEVPSSMAIVETCIASVCLWIAVWYFDSYRFLLPGIFVAPFVLFRSDKSVKCGVWLFDLWERGELVEQLSRVSGQNQWLRNERLTGMASIAARGLVGVGIAYLLTRAFLVELEGWRVFLGSVLLQLLGSSLATGAVSMMATASRNITWRGSNVAGIAGESWPESIGAAAGVLIVATSGTELSVVAGVVVGFAIDVIVTPRLRTSSGGIAVQAAAIIAILMVAGGLAAWGIIGLGMALAVGTTVYGSAAGVLFISILIRIGASLRHLVSAALGLPTNFRRLVVCTSPMQPPELVPGLPEGATKFTYETLRNEYRARTDPLDRVILLTLRFAWFFPGWLYRFLLKSMFWFWWPLAYVGDKPRKANDPELYFRLMKSNRRRITIGIAVLSLLAFVIVNLVHFLASKGGALAMGQPLSTFTVMFLLFAIGTKPVLPLAGLFSSIIALVVWIWLDEESIRWRRAKETTDTEVEHVARHRIILIERIGRIGAVCFIVFWIGAAGHVLLLTNSQRCWFQPTTTIKEAANLMYGKYAPAEPTCSPRSRLTNGS